VRRLAWLVLCGALCGCGSPSAVPAGGGQLPGPTSDPEVVKAADHSILFVGNSHTGFHDIPGLVARMIRHRHPGRTVVTQLVPAAFLEDAANNPTCRQEVESRPWKQVVLQAQKISVSGKFEYSRDGGIELAKAGKARGADVVFFAEWGLQGKEGDGAKQEQVYQEMGAASGARVACVGRAWEAALAVKPDLPLYSGDGNHQTSVGAFLTAAVLFGVLTGESPTVLADFPDPDTDEATRKLLTDSAAKAVGAK
jgi:hypothetical protein